MTIDWSKAPSWATGQGEVEGGLKVWASEESYSYTADPGSSFLWSNSKGNLAFRHRSELRSLIERPAAWNGEGKPPVGKSVCEYRGAKQYDEWTVVSIFAHYGDIVFVDYGDGWRDERDVSRFRPIRTAEQIEAIERKKAIGEMIDTYKSNYEGCVADGCQALYDAGWRKQVSQ